MFQNYFKTAIRNLAAQPLLSIINIGGLTLGLAACMLMFLFVKDELSYDQWVTDADNIYKVELTIPISGQKPLLMGPIPPAVAPGMEGYFEEIIDSTRALSRNILISYEDKFFNEQIHFADKNFFDFFNFELLSGNSKAFADNVTSIFLNERMALKYFGDQEPLGKVLQIRVGDVQTDYLVAGIFKDLPTNTHMPFQILLPFDQKLFGDFLLSYGGANMTAGYVKFSDKANIQTVEERLSKFYVNVAPPRGEGTGMDDYRIARQFNFINIKDIYLFSDKIQQLKPVGNINTVISFALAAFMVLIIASINFMNLTTARAIRRSKEVSIRKVLGAKRSQLIKQFLGESGFTALVALIGAMGLVFLALPAFNEFVDKQLAMDQIFYSSNLIVIVAASLFVGLSGGLYPALFLSAFRPTSVLGSSASTRKGSKSVSLALMVFQFSISIGLIIAAVIVQNQTSLMRTMDLGFDIENKLVVTGLSSSDAASRQAVIRQEMLNIDGVINVAMADALFPITNYYDRDFQVPLDNENNDLSSNMLFVDTDFLTLMGVKPLAGRFFSDNYEGDFNTPPTEAGDAFTRSVVISESFVKKAGYANVQAAIGTTILSDNYGDNGEPLRAVVIGVVPDLQVRPLRDEVGVFVFFVAKGPMYSMILDIDSSNMVNTLEEIDEMWKSLVPDSPINRNFLDDSYDGLYNAEQKRGEVFTVFASFAIFVACLGLFGLSSFVADQRTKEIGIRKVFGARIMQLVNLVSWYFIKPALVANIIAWPIVYMLMQNWLQNFVFRTELNLGVFVMSGLGAIILAWITVGWHAYRVAIRNPIHALRM